MSFIGNKPFVDTCLDALSSDEQISLLSTINNPNAQVSGYYKIYHAEDGFVQLQNQFPDYHKFYYVSLSFDWIMSSFHEGFLIRLGENDYGFLGFEKNNQNMIIASLRQLPGKNGEYNVLQEQLTTEEFRRVLNDLNDTPIELADKSDLKQYDLNNKTVGHAWEKFGTNLFYATIMGSEYLIRLQSLGHDDKKLVHAYRLGDRFHYSALLQESSLFTALISNSNKVVESTGLYKHKLQGVFVGSPVSLVKAIGDSHTVNIITLSFISNNKSSINSVITINEHKYFYVPGGTFINTIFNVEPSYIDEIERPTDNSMRVIRQYYNGDTVYTEFNDALSSFTDTVTEL